ncbi:hypothetical protein ACFX1Q_046130 [Malus domestica]
MSSNYDNTVKKTTGGCKGYGAKLTSSPPSSSSRWRTKCDRRSGRDNRLMLVLLVEKMENLITLLMLLTFICKVNLEILVKAQAAMVAKVRHKRLVNLMGLMVKVLNNPRCNLTHSELCSSILPSYHLNHLIDYLRPLEHNRKVYKHIRSMKETKAQS